MHEELFKQLIKQAMSKGGDYADVFVESKKATVVHLDDNRIEKVMTGSVSGIGIRLIVGRKTAYAYSNDFSEESLLQMAKTLSYSANSTDKDVVINFNKAYPSKLHPIVKPPHTVPVEDKLKLVKTANKTAWAISDKVKQVTVMYRDTYQDVTIFNSEGRFAKDLRVYSLAYVQAVCVHGDVIQTGYEPVGGLVGFELFDSVSVEQLAETAVKRALMMLTARRAPAGRMPVVISSEAGGTMIHEAIGHGLELDLVQQGLSVYAGKVGERVGSDLITVVDDATLTNKRGSFAFDDEGTPASRTVLVQNGILKGYMSDKFTSLQDGSALTGNGRRESYEHKPIVRMTNTFLLSQNSDPTKIVKSVDKGLFVKKMGGGQVNTVTGDFVFDVQEGYLIENGEIGELVRGATLIGNGPQVLMSIDMVGADLGFGIGTCGKSGQGVPVSDALPTIRIPEMVVGGEA